MSKAIRAGLAPALLLLVLWGCSTSTTEPAKYALVYGVSVYVESDAEGEGNNLTYSNDDAVSLAAQLQEEGYTVTVRTDSQATLTNLRSDIANLAATVAEDDLVLFYYSGHGGLLSDMVYPDQMAGYREESAWAFLYGSITLSGGIYSIDLPSAVYDTQLDEMLSALPCTKKVVVLDCCSSGGFVGSPAAAEADDDVSEGLPSDLDGAGVFSRAVAAYGEYLSAGSSEGVSVTTAEVLTAAGASEYSFETEYLPDGTTVGHGVFTYYFMKAATDGDLNGDGYVTALEAYAYAGAAIDTHWNSVYAGHPDYQFSPHISGGAVDYVLF